MIYIGSEIEQIKKLRAETLTDLINKHGETIRDSVGKTKLTADDVHEFITDRMESRDITIFEDIMYTVGMIDALNRLLRS